MLASISFHPESRFASGLNKKNYIYLHL